MVEVKSVKRKTPKRVAEMFAESCAAILAMDDDDAMDVVLEMAAAMPLDGWARIGARMMALSLTLPAKAAVR